MLCGKPDDEVAAISNEGVGNADDPTSSLACSRGECALNIGFVAARRCNHSDAKRQRRCLG